MSLQFTRPEFVECPTCRAKPGTPALCRECLERRELYGVLRRLQDWYPNQLLHPFIMVCKNCNGTPNPDCLEHGR